MEFKNGYRLLYQKAKDIYASKKNIPTIEDEVVDTGLTEEEKKNIKLVYEKKEGIIVNFTGLPTVDDKPIELTAGGEVVVGPSGDDPKPVNYKPFEMGQVLKVGDKIHFDTTKEAELLEHLESLDWSKYESMGAYPMLGAFAEYTMVLGAMRIPEDEHGVNFNYLLICGTAESMVGVIYIKDGMPGVLESGWHGLDADGNITLNEVPETPGYIPDSALPVTIDTLYDEAEPHWNGSIVSYVVPGPEPEKYIPFSVGDNIDIIGSFKVNTSTNIDNIFNKLPYSHDGICNLVFFENHEALADALLLAVDLSVMGATGYLIAVPDLTDTSKSTKVIYATSAGELPQMGLSWTKGWQNYTDGIVTYNLGIKDSATAEITSLDTVFDAELNGKVFGKIGEPGPTPSLTSFELGQTVKGFDFGNVSNGDINADLDAFLLALEPGSEALMVSSDDYEQLLLCGRFESRDEQPSAGIIMDNATGTFLYATDEVYEHGEKLCSKGFQNLTDGKYILPNDVVFEVAHMNEGLEDTSWNGRLVGAVLGEPGPTPSLSPLYTGQTFDIGDKIHFNESFDIDTWLANLNYEDGAAPLFDDRGLFQIIDVHTVAPDVEEGTYIFTINEYGVIYSNKTFELNGQTYAQGWQNLTDGDFIFTNYSYTIEGKPISTSPEWNGFLIGTTEL